MTQHIDPEAVAGYLSRHPEFFNEHALLLSEIRLSSPRIGNTISLHDRQMEIMREKYRMLERRMAEMVQIARSNDSLLYRIQEWTRSLLKVADNASRPHAITLELQNILSVPSATLRLWHLKEEYRDRWYAGDVSDEIIQYAEKLSVPYCGQSDGSPVRGWFDAEQQPVASLAVAPLRKDDMVFGLIVMGSPEETRFRADMATDFLSEIAKTASAALECLTA
ncbi:MAG: DUF484 family protein [Burkholderiaceae bacterium]|nr:DUF484 family protein [Burkholderiaceae bacterium]